MNSSREISQFRNKAISLIVLIRLYKKPFIIGSLFLIFLSLLSLPTPYLLKVVVDRVLPGRDMGLLNLIILTLVGIQVARLGFSYLSNYYFGVFNQEVLTGIKKDLFRRLLRLPLSFFDRQQSGYLLCRVDEVEGLSLFFSSTTVRLALSVLEFIFSLVILFALNWKLTLIALGILPLLYIATKHYSGRLRRLSWEVMEKGAMVSSRVQEALTGVDVVKVFGAEERETSRLHGLLDDLKQANIQRTVKTTLSSELLGLIGALGGYIILWYSGWDIIRGSFTLGSYIAFSGYLARLYGPTQMLASAGLIFQPAFSALDRYRELMEAAGEEEKDKGRRVERLRGEIEFREVYFSYDGQKPVFEGLNLRISAGEKVLITGPNGSGKSTLMKLLLGLYRPQRGEIIIDGYNIEELSLSSLRERISVVSQNVFLFNDTVWNNILYSCPEATDTEVRQAAVLSGAAKFIEKLEQGYNTVVGETGKKLSGGEKQKIALARALVKDADILIFDEATAHLDKESEARIERLITDNFKDKTCLIISHKKWDILGIDRIIELEFGTIIKQE
ncbi:MAG: ABC transporter ATP-binding protein [Candidatus Aminicenantes bacterium]|nr:ABC transporter ATP-binding protein [Candidatus Aminicenantes bacterium]